MTVRGARAVESADEAMATLIALLDGAWAVAGFAQLAGSAELVDGGLLAASPEQRAAAGALAAVGLAVEAGDGYQLAPGLAEMCSTGSLETWRAATMSSLRQLATVVGILAGEVGDGWAAHDDATLLAQGLASAVVGHRLAAAAIHALDGLGQRFADRGEFLDIGMGVGELTAAFCETLPGSRVVGIDVMPRALDLARRTLAERGLTDRVDVRLQASQDLDDIERFDLAWLPAPYIPKQHFRASVARVHDALRPGGWVVLGAGRMHCDPLAVAVARWQTLRAAGTPVSAEDACTALGAAGFVGFTALPTPRWAPALYAAQRPKVPTPV